MNSQKPIANKITQNGVDFTMCVKDNHKTHKKEMAAYFHKIYRENVNSYLQLNRLMDSINGLR